MSNGFSGVPENATAQQVFEEIMPQRLAGAKEKYGEMMQGIVGVLQFELTGEGGGKWFIELNEGEAKVTAGEHASPTTTFIIETQDYLAMLRREVDPQQLFMSGKMRITGDMSLAMRLGQLIRQAMETS